MKLITEFRCFLVTDKKSAEMLVDYAINKNHKLTVNEIQKIANVLMDGLTEVAPSDIIRFVNKVSGVTSYHNELLFSYLEENSSAMYLLHFLGATPYQPTNEMIEIVGEKILNEKNNIETLLSFVKTYNNDIKNFDNYTKEICKNGTTAQILEYVDINPYLSLDDYSDLAFCMYAEHTLNEDLITLANNPKITSDIKDGMIKAIISSRSNYEFAFDFYNEVEDLTEDQKNLLASYISDSLNSSFIYSILTNEDSKELNDKVVNKLETDLEYTKGENSMLYKAEYALYHNNDKINEYFCDIYNLQKLLIEYAENNKQKIIDKFISKRMINDIVKVNRLIANQTNKGEN